MNRQINIQKSLLHSTANTRDLGGYKSQIFGTYTKYNRIYRSDELLKISGEDIEFLIRENVTTIIDVRSSDVVFEKPSEIQHIESFNYYNIPINEGSKIPDCCENVAKGYMTIAAARNIADVFRRIEYSTTGVLIHCSAGKDRTGVLSALLLMLCGVSIEDIAYNYQLTKDYSMERLNELHHVYPELDMRIIVPNKNYMVNFARLFLEKYNSIEQYFQEIGFDKHEQDIIRSKLLF